MRLSEAIRLGAMLRPQGMNTSSMYWWLDERPTCALGAALHALGLKDALYELAFHLIRNAYPWVDNGRHDCPLCSNSETPMRLIYHLNDIHKCSREFIADCVKTLEPSEPPVPVPVAGEVVGVER